MIISFLRSDDRNSRKKYDSYCCIYTTSLSQRGSLPTLKARRQQTTTDAQ